MKAVLSLLKGEANELFSADPYKIFSPTFRREESGLAKSARLHTVNPLLAAQRLTLPILGVTNNAKLVSFEVSEICTVIVFMVFRP